MNIWKIFSLVAMVLFFVGCNNGTKLVYKEGSYQTSECRKELRSGGHFKKDKKIDKIIVSKKKHEMYIYKNKKKIHTFRISIGKNPKGHKVKMGDHRTPEGSYFITRKKCHPKYYRMIFISYPNSKDIKAARVRGDSPGSAITIHAQPFWNDNGKGNNFTLSKDWTNGCIAITNNAMDMLWYAIDYGIPIKIVA